ncbi:MAG: class I SAM-dependent methyltransferase [Planctomycetes bacterium]|nr:class I SAM-dependent methyltransferase [Planctomycetota bacterium]
MTPALLRRLFPNDVHHVAGFRYELAARLPEVGRVLDLGCGANAELEDYRTDGREVWGADFEPHPHLRHPEWFRALRPDGAIPFPDGHFDAVASVMVLEHVAEPTRFLREVARVLRPGGHFVGHTVSGSHYVTWLRRAFGLLPHGVNQALVRRLYGRPEVDTFPAFYRLNTRRQMLRACRATDLRLLRLRRYADPGYFGFTRWTAGAAVALDRLLAGGSSALGRLYLTAVLAKPRG